MINKIIVKDNTKSSNILLFKEMTFNKITLLCGPNGSGKSTVINQLNMYGKFNDCDFDIDSDKEFDIYAYVNSCDNYRYSIGRPVIGQDTDVYDDRVIKNKLSAESLSEGQAIIYSMSKMLNNLISLPFSDSRDILVLFDEIDSGLSVDNIQYVMDIIRQTSEARDDIQFVITFNNYAVCEDIEIVKDMITGNDLSLLSYKEFYKFITNMHNTILKARHGNMFTGKL